MAILKSLGLEDETEHTWVTKLVLFKAYGKKSDVNLHTSVKYIYNPSHFKETYTN